MARILLTTVSVVGRSGTEVVTDEMARGLQNRGHEVAVFCPLIGPLAEGLRVDGVSVVSDIGAVPWRPDVIQTNHTPQLIETVGRFPDVPIVAICHSATAWYSEPIDLPSICKHMAVDLACRDRIARRFPHLADRIEILHNAVDLDRFRPRERLPPGPKRALILTKQAEHVAILRQVCAKVGLSYDTLGPGVGKQIDDLPSRLLEYDVVFATARMAIEALAVGCAVVVVDARGLAGMVTSDVVASWRDNNFGLLLLVRKVTVADVIAELSRYDANDAAGVSDYVRRFSSLSSCLDRLEQIHREVIADHLASPPDRDGIILGLSRAFSAVSSLEHQTQVRDWVATIVRLDTELNDARANVRLAEAQLKDFVENKLTAAENARRNAENQLRLSQSELELTKGELRRVEHTLRTAVHRSTTRAAAVRLSWNLVIYVCCLHYLNLPFLPAVTVGVVASMCTYFHYGQRWVESIGLLLLAATVGVWIGALPPVREWPDSIDRMRAGIMTSSGN